MLYQLSYCGGAVKRRGCLRFLLSARKREITFSDTRAKRRGNDRSSGLGVGFASAAVPAYKPEK
jgi:hypothetical protein